MADYITKIMTAKGAKQIDYNALANLPDLSEINTSEYDLVLRLNRQDYVTSIAASDIEIASGDVLESFNKIIAGDAVRVALLHDGSYQGDSWTNIFTTTKHTTGISRDGTEYWYIQFDGYREDTYIQVNFNPLVSSAVVRATMNSNIGQARVYRDGLMSASDKEKLDAYQPTAIITHNSTTSLPTSAAEGTILIAYDA